MGRYGPMVQIGHQDEEEKPRFAKLKADQSIETITMQEAMELFSLPRVLGTYNDMELSVNVGRFGPYIKLGEQFISIPKGEDLHTMDIDRAIVLLGEKELSEAPIAHYKELPVTKGKGRFGPFIKWDGIFINIPRAYDFDNLSDSDINELIEKKLEKEANRYIQNWPTEKISIENGRWGPFIKFNKKMLKLGRKADGTKYEAADLAGVDLETVKAMIELQVPGAFSKKAKAPAKKSATKAATKKAAPKKAAVKKPNTKK
jgi:DNA topoisomerase-1